MTIENEPKLLIKNEKIYLSASEISQIKDFASKCQEEIKQIANGKIDHIEFFEKIRFKGFRYG
jgi:hypothetical protein